MPQEPLGLVKYEGLVKVEIKGKKIKENAYVLVD